ncbi:unnamed protein product [Diamesa tonsa]
MASSDLNLVDSLEESFQACIHSLTKEESSAGVDKDEIKLEVEQNNNEIYRSGSSNGSIFPPKAFPALLL